MAFTDWLAFMDEVPFKLRFSLPGPLGSFPVICRVVPDDMSNSRERKMIAQRHDPIGRDTVQDGLARLDRLGGLVVEDWPSSRGAASSSLGYGRCQPYA